MNGLKLTMLTGSLFCALVLYGRAAERETVKEPAPEPAVNVFQQITYTDKSAITEYIEDGHDLQVVQQHTGFTPLHLATIQDNAEVVRLLLEAGAGIDVRDKLGRTPLHMAAVRGHRAVLVMLLRHGADPNTRDRDGCTPLHLAVINRHLPLIDMLPVWGADLQARSYDQGLTPLHWAAFIGCIDSVKILLDAGADIHATDKSGRTAYAWARYARNPTVRMLARYGGHWTQR